jgi:hypothetical protein
MFWFDIFQKPILLPLNSTLPDEEIIFTPVDANGDPVQKIGFIDLKGNIKTRSIIIPMSFLFQNSPFKIYDNTLGRIYTWSLSGNSIGIISPIGSTNGQGYPIIVSDDGKSIYCPPVKSIIAQDNILVISSNEIMAIEISLIDQNQDLITFDMEKCRLSKVNYHPKGNETLESFSFARDKWLAIEFNTTEYWRQDKNNDDFIGTRIFDPDMNIIREIKNASSPTFSPNGRMIAFINELGEVCISDIGDFSPKCSGKANDKISWSSDGKWLLYSNMNDEIIIQEVSTGKEKNISKGIYPDWRP